MARYRSPYDPRLPPATQHNHKRPPGPYRTPFADARPVTDDEEETPNGYKTSFHVSTRYPTMTPIGEEPPDADPRKPRRLYYDNVNNSGPNSGTIRVDQDSDSHIPLQVPPPAAVHPRQDPRYGGQKPPPHMPRPSPYGPPPTQPPPTYYPPSRQSRGSRSDQADVEILVDPPELKGPLKKRMAPIALFFFLCYLTATSFYLYTRVRFTLDMGYQTWYGVYILAVEIVGISSVLPYGLLLVMHTTPHKRAGLPRDDGRTRPVANFHVRVLVPCYKESMATIMATVGAALQADLPAGCQRTLYLCDDGNNPEKAAFVRKLGPQAVYVTGRNRQPGEINGKSANLNNCLQNVIYKDYNSPEEIPPSEVIVVFDADMVARKNFFLKVLHVMCDDTTALCLTPQAFSNINPSIDIFNNINLQFWEYILPGCDALGYIACTGTNFCVRARALGSVGWFPEYTITEDYALSMELKRAGFKGRYLLEYLAVGEAPDEIRNVFRQRSRWTKGHMQVFFSRRCPLFQWKLPFLMKVLYTYGTWSYFATIITTYTFLLVPFISLVFGWHPVSFNRKFAFAATLYLGSTFLVMSYVRKLSHLKSLWLAQVSNYILCFTYFKAVLNTLLALIGFKEKAGFKATDKKGPVAALMKMMSRAPSRRGPESLQAPLPQQMQPPSQYRSRASQYRSGQTRIPMAPPPQTKEEEQTGCCCSKAGDLQCVLDPLALFVCLVVCLMSLAAGVYKLVDSVSASDVWLFLRTGRLGVHTLLPVLWLAYNAIPPLLFFIYCYSRGPAMEKAAVVLQALGSLLSAAALASLWFKLPVTYDLKEVLPMTVNFYNIQKSGFDIQQSPTIPVGYKKNLTWVASSGWNDPVVGGYYMGADYVKYTFPMSYVVAMTGWSMIQFKEGYQKAGQMDAMVDNLKHGADYLMKAHVQDEELVAQIGYPEDYVVDAETTEGFWGMPDKWPNNRTATKLNPASKGGTDLFASTAAALAITSQVFNTSDINYSKKTVEHAKRLYKMAQAMTPPSDYCKALYCAGRVANMTNTPEWMAFPSSSIYDDLAWAAIWLFKATGERSYSDDAESHIRTHLATEFNRSQPHQYIPSYDNMGWAASMVIASELNHYEHQSNVNSFLRSWLDGNLNKQTSVVAYTPRGLAFTPDNPLPNVAAVAFLGTTYTSLPTTGLDRRLKNNIRCWAYNQVAYILGGRFGKDRSFVVGYGNKWPRQPRHRQASCDQRANSECTVRTSYVPIRPNPHELTGALVAGPGKKDKFTDNRKKPGTAVGLHWNAAFTGALAGLLQYDVKTAECQAGNGFYEAIFLGYAPQS